MECDKGEKFQRKNRADHFRSTHLIAKALINALAGFTD